MTRIAMGKKGTKLLFETSTPGTSLARTASVSVVEKVGTSAKQGNEVFSLQLLRNNSIGNACYAG